MVMPRSRSSSFESMTRSTTGWLALKMPLCRSMASTKVVLPWSTCAMMARLRMLGFTGSPRRPPAVDQNRMAGNERRRRRCQEHDRAGYVHRLADTVQGRDALDPVSASSVPGVEINVGATAFTVMLYLPHSTARHLVRCAMAALLMQYTDSVGSATKPAWELILMMRPRFWRIITRPAAWLAKNVPFRFKSTV